MGDLNQFDFVIENRKMVTGPILEIGSKDYGNTNDFRIHFAPELYIGTDQEHGKGVDILCDFTEDFNDLSKKIGIKKFGTIICFSVLEHCKHPFKMAENINKFLSPDGIIFVSVPFVWNIHAFPDDYWRFTPSSLPLLFPDCELIPEKSFYSTKIRGERFSFNTNLAKKEWLKASPIMRVMKKIGLIKSIYPYVLFPVMVNGLLVKKGFKL